MRLQREKEGERLLNICCSDCLNLQPDNWCKAKKRTVSGTRHLRKCDLFIQGEPNPLPVRIGKPQHPDLVQCTSCENFTCWGCCGAGVGELGGELGSRIRRYCGSHIPVESTGSCSSCTFLYKQVCMVSGFKVTNPNSPTTCRKYCTNQNP